jgi:hypothetical protein
MKLSKLLIIIAILNISTSIAEAKSNYTPKYKKTWNKVEQFAIQNWYTSKVDVSKQDWLKKTGIVPPTNFMAIAAGHPT